MKDKVLILCNIKYRIILIGLLFTILGIQELTSMNSKIHSQSTVIVVSEPQIFRKEADVDSLMLWWFMLGEAEAVNDFMEQRRVETIGNLSECSPEVLMAFNFYLIDILKRKGYEKEMRLNTAKLNALCNLLERNVQVDFSKLKESFPKSEENALWAYLGEKSLSKLSDDDLFTLRALAGNKGFISALLKFKDRHYKPERIALYQCVFASITRSPELTREAGLGMIKKTVENGKYFPAGVNLLTRAITDGDTLSARILDRIDSTLRAIFDLNPLSADHFEKLDSRISVQVACGEDYMPYLWWFILDCHILEDGGRNKIYDVNGSFFRKLPMIFFGGTYYSNSQHYWRDIASNVIHTSENMNLWIHDFCIENIEEYKDKVDSTLISNLQDKYLSGVRQIDPEFIHDKYYPKGKRLVIFPTQELSTIDLLRLNALCGNQEATEQLEQYYRSNNAIGEMAFYYYFQALSENNPDKIFRAAQMMYEDSHQRPYALASMINMLKAGQRMGSEQCATALDDIYQIASDPHS